MTNRYIGIDVGGVKKGFHGVCIENNNIISKINNTDAAYLSFWCHELKPHSIAIDSPCGWSITGYSRKAERELKINDQRIKCFCTPKRKYAIKSNFYGWVLNGRVLYSNLKKLGYLPIETYPHGICCTVGIDKKISKFNNRLNSLSYFSINMLNEKCIDFLDAALCSVTAKYFNMKKTIKFGNSREGFIYLPNLEI